jgi:hypothetical protein
MNKGWTWKEVPIDDEIKKILGPKGNPITFNKKRPMGFGIPHPEGEGKDNEDHHRER